MEELKEGWRRVRLKDITKGGKGDYGIGASAVEFDKKLPTYLRISDINDDGTLNKTSLKSLNEKDYKKYILKDGDIVFARTGNSTGRAYLYNKEDGELVYAGFLIKFSLDQLKVNEKYIGLYTLTSKYKNWINSFSTGSTRGNINAQTYGEMLIEIPPRNLQDKIVKIFNSILEKIELNRKINQNLEEICQNYFVEIFIKNSNKNCSIGQISDLGNIVSGATPSKKNQKYYTNFGIPWITPKDLSKISNKFISRGNLDITELGFKNSSVRLLPKGSVLFSSRAPIGYIAICSNDVTTNQGFKSIVPFKNIGTEFVYYFLKNNVQFLESRASGSTFKEISTTIMATTPAIIPKEEPLKVFKKICVNIFEKQYIIEKETEKLIELRDYLLPRLMSGEISV